MLQIRPYRPEDLPAVQEIDRLTWAPHNNPGPQPPALLEEYGKRIAHRTLLVAERGGSLCGYVGLDAPLPLPSCGHVTMVDVAVHPQHQRQGVATTLMRAAEAVAREQGQRKIRLRVLATNPGAMALYRHLGYEEEGRLRREFWLDEHFVDDVLMAKWLDDSASGAAAPKS